MSNLKVLRTCVILVAAIFMTATTPAVNAAKAPKAKSAAGREGAAANTILSGRGAPKASLGTDGDFYIDVTSYTIYGPKKNNKWPSGVNLKGPQGEAGKAGEKGSAGNAGAATKGDKGEKGERGDKGDRGEKGDAGVAGATGPSGPAGAQGATGPQGAAGPTGAAGPQGAVGPAGAPGAKGDTGDAGVKGDTGDIGPAGPSNVATGSITFLNSVVGSAGQTAQSETFGALTTSKNYQVDLVIYGTGALDTNSLPLKFEIVGHGISLVTSGLQWLNMTSSSIRSGSTKVEHSVMARFAIKASESISTYSLKAYLTTGAVIMADRNVSFTGNFRIQEVGNVT